MASAIKAFSLVCLSDAYVAPLSRAAKRNEVNSQLIQNPIAGQRPALYKKSVAAGREAICSLGHSQRLEGSH